MRRGFAFLVILLLCCMHERAWAQAPYRPALTLDEVTLYVPNLVAAERFYKDGLGLREVGRDGTSLTLESSLGSALRLEASSGHETRARFSLRTDSLAAVGISLRRRGVEASLESGDEGMWLRFEDPFGNNIEVREDSPASLTVMFHRIGPDGLGERVGDVQLHFGPFGMVVVPALEGLPPGPHSIHVHAFGDCGPAPGEDGRPIAGLAAGGHYQPDDLAWMGSPVGEGTLGDLPDLYAGLDGRVMGAVVAPEVRRADVVGRAIMIHERSDATVAVPQGGTDQSKQARPQAAGTMDHTQHMMASGPNPRMACGVVPK